MLDEPQAPPDRSGKPHNFRTWAAVALVALALLATGYTVLEVGTHKAVDAGFKRAIETAAPPSPGLTPVTPTSVALPSIQPADPADQTAAEIAALIELRAEDPSMTLIPNRVLLNFMDKACASWRKGATFNRLLDIALAEGNDPVQVGLLLATAPSLYCPDQSAKLPGGGA